MEYSDAVEQWAREHGGHATLKWLEAPMNCWAVVLRYRVGDPRQATPSDGEPVLLHEYWTAEQWQKRKPHMVRRHPQMNHVVAGNYAFELDELGIEGIRKWLDRGNILSGRGEFGGMTPEQIGRKTVERHADEMDRLRTKSRDDAGHRAKDIRRQIYRIPFVGVGIEFNKPNTTSKETT